MPILRKSSTLISSHQQRAGYKAALLAAITVSLVLLVAVSICVGAVRIPPGQLLAILTGMDASSRYQQIISLVRWPRTLAAILAGCTLSVAGAILQTVLDNSLASPSVIGVNAGSGLFTIALAAYFPSMLRYLPLAAFLGAVFAVLIVYSLARWTGASRMTIVLAGIAVSSFLSAFTDVVLTLVPNARMARIDFLIGSFSGVTMDNIRFAAGYILLGVTITLFLSHDMNVLALGEETASSLGLRTGLYRMVFLITAALLAGSAVSFSGLIGFVGLIVPHTSRMLVGQDHRFVLPMSALLGAAFTLGCDILARTLFAPFEIPVGIVMSFLGGPFFLYLLLGKKRRTLLD